MGVNLRLPNISGVTEREQLGQIRNYLYQLVEQLQWALSTVGSSDQSYYVVTSTPKSTTPQASPKTVETVDFDAIKPLIIKSADIVQAYYEEINSRLVGEYVAESDFGTFVEQTELNIIKSSTDIELVFSNIQKIFTSIENLNFTLAEVNAHIKPGILYYEDGIPVYGLEIGQKNTIDGVEVFNKYARFTSNKLSFYDQNGTEVAYISDYKLYITNMEITGTAKFGAFLLNTTKGFRLKYVGRG